MTNKQLQELREIEATQPQLTEQDWIETVNEIAGL